MTKPTHIFSDNIEAEALAQFHSAMEMDFAVAGALMPDAHSGYTLPIGAVVAAKDVVVPAWVGYDIGCGMCAVPLLGITPDELRAHASSIFGNIYRDVPTGFAHHSKAVMMPGNLLDLPRTDVIAEQIAKGAMKQLGTLGSGNHFVEIGADEDEQAWIIIHSGSRNLGHKTATYYMKLASGDGKAREAHLPLSVYSEEGIGYINDMNFCLAFALENRRRILDAVIGSICHATKKPVEGNWSHLINRNHNHAELRLINHSGPTRDMIEVWIHRKGATHAEDGMMGVVPGNMRDGSFIVRGKGSPTSLFSSSHGAGRVLGRKKAQATLNVDEFKTTMEGITAKVGESTLDESPFAYKDIFQVMKEQSGLVEVVAHVKPIINIKA